ncbi:hypothetical protein D3C72_872020 [compost metagenome]
MLFALDTQPLGLGAGCDDQRVGGPDLTGIGLDHERPYIGFNFGDEVTDDFRTHMGRLLQHLIHQPRALDRIGKARIVLDIGGDHQLAALFHAGNQHGFQHCAGRVDRRGITGGTRANDQYLGMAGRHGNIPFYGSGAFQQQDLPAATRRTGHNPFIARYLRLSSVFIQGQPCVTNKAVVDARAIL